MNPHKKANCEVLGDGSNAADSAHVSMTTPMKTKRAEIMNDPQYRTNLNDGFDTKREKATTKARREGNVRPLDGGAAKRKGNL